LPFVSPCSQLRWDTHACLFLLLTNPLFLFLPENPGVIDCPLPSPPSRDTFFKPTRSRSTANDSPPHFCVFYPDYSVFFPHCLAFLFFPATCFFPSLPSCSLFSLKFDNRFPFPRLPWSSFPYSPPHCNFDRTFPTCLAPSFLLQALKSIAHPLDMPFPLSLTHAPLRSPSFLPPLPALKSPKVSRNGLLSPARHPLFFEESYRLTPTPISFLTDPPPTRLDLSFCVHPFLFAFSFSQRRFLNPCPISPSPYLRVVVITAKSCYLVISANLCLPSEL